MTSEAEISFINFLIDPTCHAVTRLESFTGFGNEPSLTFRHKVAELNGRSGVGLGLFVFGWVVGLFMPWAIAITGPGFDFSGCCVWFSLFQFVSYT